MPGNDFVAQRLRSGYERHGLGIDLRETAPGAATIRRTVSGARIAPIRSAWEGRNGLNFSGRHSRKFANCFSSKLFDIPLSYLLATIAHKE
jgi:hypothetical protein